jgi:hypothetical protein
MNSEILKQIKVIKLYNVLLQTLEEVGTDGLGGIPSGHAYMAYSGMLNVDQFQMMLNGLQKQNVINVKRDFITMGKDFHQAFDSYQKLEKAFDDKVKQLRGESV